MRFWLSGGVSATPSGVFTRGLSPPHSPGVQARSEAVVKSSDKYCLLNTTILRTFPGFGTINVGEKAVD